METTRSDVAGRHVPVRNNAQGWGVAAGITILVIACFAFAYWVHSTTYLHPRDTGFKAVGAESAGH